MPRFNAMVNCSKKLLKGIPKVRKEFVEIGQIGIRDIQNQLYILKDVKFGTSNPNQQQKIDHTVDGQKSYSTTWIDPSINSLLRYFRGVSGNFG